MTIKVTIPSVDVQTKPRITVFGVGGAGGNAVNNMIRSNLEGVEFVVSNTDAQALANSLAPQRVQLGSTITRGLGAGSRPDVGRAAAEEQLEEIMNHLSGTNMCFITAGMGGGTGTGAAPVIARAAREQGILTVGVVTKPFNFEGAHRMRTAENGIQELAQYVDTLIIIPNQNLFRIANERTTFADAFKMADDVLHAGVRGVTDLMVMPGLINLDFADIRTVMTEMGKAMMGTGEASGERRAVEAAEAAISNPLLDDISMRGARGVLINITGGMDMTLFEVDEAANRIRDEVDPEANIIFGSTFDESMEGKMRVSVVATGIETVAAQQSRPQAQPTLTVVHDRAAEAKRHFPTAAPAMRPAMGGAAAMTQPSHFATLQPAPMAPAPTAGLTPDAEQAARMEEAYAPMQEAAAAPEMHMEEMPVAPMQPAMPQPAPAPTGPLRGERKEGAFIAPRPAEAGPRAGATNPQRFQPAQPEPKKKGFLGNLFGRVTGASEPAPQQARPAPAPQPQMSRPAPQPAPQQPTGVEHAPRAKPATEDDMLDIPAFLRRQAN
ncbi:cell division protein FtsZ [Indioceanicola profundi]|uniref:cell division protein FtsZ n=1 Tax=Indioceanicola profundi TaxID=2220096 RepID=UPI000E6ADCBA|nr:cell division protein FtsZ [Indioceanicola profundi]